MFEFVDAYDRAYEAAAVKRAERGAGLRARPPTRPRGMGELAEELGCDASNITQIIARLETRALVRRQPHPHDRRSRQIIRTTTGDSLYDDFEESFEFARSALANLNAKEQDQLAVLLRKALAGR